MRLLALALLAVLAAAAPAAADTFVVDRSDDADVSTCSAAANDCTLRGAIEKVQAVDAPGSTVTIPATRIVLTAKLPDLATGSFTIAGAGARQTTVSGNGTVGEIFTGTFATVTLQDLTVTGGKGALFGSGAVSGDIDLERVAIVDNDEYRARRRARARPGQPDRPQPRRPERRRDRPGQRHPQLHDR